MRKLMKIATLAAWIGILAASLVLMGCEDKKPAPPKEPDAPKTQKPAKKKVKKAVKTPKTTDKDAPPAEGDKPPPDVEPDPATVMEDYFDLTTGEKIEFSMADVAKFKMQKDGSYLTPTGQRVVPPVFCAGCYESIPMFVFTPNPKLKGRKLKAARIAAEKAATCPKCGKNPLGIK